MPVDEEAPEDGGLDRLHLVTKPRQRAPPQRPQHLRVAPLAAVTAGTELALDDASALGKPSQGAEHDARAEPEARARLSLAVNGRMRPRVAPHEFRHRRPPPARAAPRAGPSAAACRVRRDSGRHPPRRWPAPRPRHVPAGPAARSISAGSAAREAVYRARPQLVRHQVAEPQQQIVDGVRRSGVKALLAAAAARRGGIERLGVQQLAQLALANQFAQLRLVHGQCLRAALGQRCVAVVEVVGDVAEQERRGKRRRRAHVHRRHSHRTAAHFRQQIHERRHVEDVAQALAIGLEDDRERSEASGDRQQVGRALALLPERRARAGPAARQQQRPPCRFAEPGREHRGGRRVAARRALPPRRGRARTACCPAADRLRAPARRTHRRSTSLRHPGRARRAAGRPPPWPRARAPGCRTGSAARCANRPSSSADRSMRIVRSSGMASTARC